MVGSTVWDIIASMGNYKSQTNHIPCHVNSLGKDISDELGDPIGVELV